MTENGIKWKRPVESEVKYTQVLCSCPETALINLLMTLTNCLMCSKLREQVHFENNSQQFLVIMKKMRKRIT